jgi:Flp pilus assembly protein TadG
LRGASEKQSTRSPCFSSSGISALGNDHRGNVFVLFGAAAIPLMLILGGAVDFARYTRYRTDLANAVDAAPLALARKHPDLDAATRRIHHHSNAIITRRQVQCAKL